MTMFIHASSHQELIDLGEKLQSNRSTTTGLCSQSNREKNHALSRQSAPFDVKRMHSDKKSVQPYSTQHFLSFRYKNAVEVQKVSTEEAELQQANRIKLTNEGPVTEKRSCVTPDHSDTSMCSLTSSPSCSPTSGIETPPNRSASSSPDSGCATSPDTDTGPARKQARTNYTPAQIRTLEKIFFENPYPDSEHMETISNDLGVAENKIKIWFQNKRARWRRRVAASKNNTSPLQTMPAVPSMPTQFHPYGHYPFPSPMMTSQYLPGYYPGSYPTNRNYGMAGMVTSQTREQIYTDHQWQQYQRHYPLSQQMNQLMSQQHPMTSLSQPEKSSIYTMPVYSNDHMNVTR